MIKKTSHGTVVYTNDKNQWHREDGPAAEWLNGDKAWYINDILHRIDGPAVENSNGTESYCIMGKEFSYEEWLAIKDFPLLW